MIMPGRSYSATNEYRYGFNGKENDKDISGGGQDYGMRVYDSRLGKFLSVDPLTQSYPWYTPYQFAGNKPVVFVDIDGLEEGIKFDAYLAASELSKSKLSLSDAMTVARKNRELLSGFSSIDNKAAAITGLVLADIFLTRGRVSMFLLNAQLLSAFEHNRFESPERQKVQSERTKGALADGIVGWSAVKFIGGVFSAAKSGIPQGLTTEEFSIASQRIYNKVGDVSDDIFVQGSRAAKTANHSSDIDFAIRVSPKEFDKAIVKSFGNPNEGSAKWRTMQHAIETGKIQSGEAGLSSLRKNLEKLLGKEVDISIIKEGGKFDTGVIIPIKKP